jgi:hypothetical protein
MEVSCAYQPSPLQPNMDSSRGEGDKRKNGAPPVETSFSLLSAERDGLEPTALLHQSRLQQLVSL